VKHLKERKKERKKENCSVFCKIWARQPLKDNVAIVKANNSQSRLSKEVLSINSPPPGSWHEEV